MRFKHAVLDTRLSYTRVSCFRELGILALHMSTTPLKMLCWSRYQNTNPRHENYFFTTSCNRNWYKLTALSVNTLFTHPVLRNV